MNNYLLRLPGILLLLLIVGCDGEQQIEEEILRPVRYTKAKLYGGTVERIFSGVAKAKLESTLSFKVAGTLQKRPVNVGDQLEPAQLVASLDATDFNISVHEAEAGMSNALAEVRRTRANYTRMKSLYENDNASKSDLDAARASADSAKAQLESAEQRLQSNKLQLSYTRLYSPGRCAVAETYKKVNENVGAGTAVMRVNCGDCLEVKVSVAEAFINQVTSGSEVSVVVDALKNKKFKAIVTEVGIASTESGAAYPVTAALQEGCNEVRSGMAADVIFNLARGDGKPYIGVPALAVGEDRNGRHVFVLKENSDGNWQANRRKVEIGEFVNEDLSILSGLEANELVITAGIRRIVDGQKVKLLQGLD